MLRRKLNNQLDSLFTRYYSDAVESKGMKEADDSADHSHSTWSVSLSSTPSRVRPGNTSVDNHTRRCMYLRWLGHPGTFSYASCLPASREEEEALTVDDRCGISRERGEILISYTSI